MGGFVPGGNISIDLERSTGSGRLGIIVSLVYVKPTIDERIVVVSALDSIRRIHMTTGIWGAVRDGIPWLIWTNKVNRLYLGAITFVCRGVSIWDVKKRNVIKFQQNTDVYAAVGVVLYVKLSLFQSPPRHSLRMPWSPPSHEGLDSTS